MKKDYEIQYFKYFLSTLFIFIISNIVLTQLINITFKNYRKYAYLTDWMPRKHWAVGLKSLVTGRESLSAEYDGTQNIH